MYNIEHVGLDLVGGNDREKKQQTQKKNNETQGENKGKKLRTNTL